MIQFKDYEKMLYKMCWSFTKTTGIPFEELLSTAYFSFEQAKEKYNEEKGCFSTYFYCIAKSRLIEYSRNQYEYQENEVQSSDQIEISISNSINLEQEVIFKSDILGNLSDQAQTICKMIFENPVEFLEGGRPKLSRGKIKNKLRQIGWSWSQIWDSFREIKTALNQF
jgi:RNA polymerase sigma factor (sigma-70 family)